MQSPIAGISVIIPTCDRPEYLREALASVQAQDKLPREILVIDNGTIAARPENMPPDVQLFRLAPRVGPSRARNFGAAIATSRYLAFLDDDDSWEPSFLREAIAVLETEQVRCVYGRKATYESGTLTHYKLPTAENLNIATLLRRNPGTGGMNLLIERQMFLEIGGFDERLRLSEDRALALEILLSGEKIGVAPGAVAIVRHHASDRLRQRSIRKLPFVWKYRRLYSARQFVLAIAHILAKTSLSPALRAFQGLRSRRGSGERHPPPRIGATQLRLPEGSVLPNSPLGARK